MCDVCARVCVLLYSESRAVEYVCVQCCVRVLVRFRVMPGDSQIKALQYNNNCDTSLSIKILK